MEEEKELHTCVHTYILHACVNSYSDSGVYILTWIHPPKLWVKRKRVVWGEEEDIAFILDSSELLDFIFFYAF